MSRMLRLLLVVSFVLPALLAGGTAGAASGWTPATNVPTPRNSLASAVASNGSATLIYTFGGFAIGGGDNPGYRRDVEAYDPATNTWSCSVGDTAAGCASATLAPMTFGRYLFTAVMAGNKIYVIGGQTYTASSLATVEMYDPVANTWTTKASMNVARAQHAATVGLDGKIYVSGGNYADNTLEVYDPAANTWTRLANMLAGRYAQVMETGADGKLYVIGGANSGAAGEGNVVQVYDPATNTWSEGPSSPTERFGSASAVSAGGNIYVSGGSYNVQSVDMLVPSTGAWVTRPALPRALAGHQLERYTDGTLYAIGGGTVDPLYYAIAGLPEVYVYTPTGYLSLSALGGAKAGPVTVTVTARADDGSVDTAYRGTVSFSASGGGSTLPANYTFTATDAGARAFTLTLSSSGTYTVSVTDTADPALTAQATIAVDGTAPTTTANGNGYSFGAWTKNSVTVSLSANDNVGGFGVGKTYYTLDGGGTLTYSSPIAITTEGAHALTYWSVDTLGNFETASSVAINIDQTAPDVSCDAIDTFWHGANITVNCWGSDALSGMASPTTSTSTLSTSAPRPLRVRGEEPPPPRDTPTFTLSTSVADGVETDAAATNSVTVCDLAANCVTAGPLTPYKIDRKAPSINAAAQTADSQPYASGTWTNQSVTVSFSCADGGSGVASCAGPQTISSQGTNQSVNGQASDAVANTSTATFSGINIDITAPTTTANGNGYAFGDWTNGTVRVTLDANDTDGSGVAATFYTLDGGAAQTYTSGGFDVGGAGVHDVAFWSRDVAGNVEATQTVQVRIDTAGPVVTCAAADGVWHADNVTIACGASDADSGLANSADASFTLATNVPDGVETADAATDSREVCDAVGNCSIAGPVNGYQIDRADPTIAIVAPVDGATYARKQPAFASFTCSDGGAGVAACDGTVANGAAFDTTTPGPREFSVTATDNVGNSATRVVRYQVIGDMSVAAIYGARMACASPTGFCLTFGVQIKGQGDPLAGVLVTAELAGPSGAPVTQTATTNASGGARFVIPVTGPGTYTLTVRDATADYFTYAPEQNVVTSRGFAIGGRFR